MASNALDSLLRHPPRFLFFTGKGGVGKTSLSCACALALAASGTRDPLLTARAAGESAQIARVTGGLAARTYLVPWVPQPPVGIDALRGLLRAGPAAPQAGR